MERSIHRLLAAGVCLHFFIIGWICSVPESMAQTDGGKIVIADVFEPGLGQPVGVVQLFQGEVYIFHENKPGTGYAAETGLSLFNGDLITTKSDGKVSLKFNDGSVVTLASDTRLTISRAIYDPDRTKTRQSFISIAFGKVRFWVKKLTAFKRSDYKVKTKTAVVGVRGSDFIVKATLKRTEVTALENTNIEVISLLAVEAELDRPFVLTDYEQAVVRAGELPSQLQNVIPEEIELMKKEFMIIPEKGLIARKKADEPDVFKKIVPDGVLVSNRYIVDPVLSSQVIETVNEEDPLLVKLRKDVPQADKNPEQVGDELHENVLEDSIKELPGFPGEPGK